VITNALPLLLLLLLRERDWVDSLKKLTLTPEVSRGAAEPKEEGEERVNPERVRVMKCPGRNPKASAAVTKERWRVVISEAIGLEDDNDEEVNPMGADRCKEAVQMICFSITSTNAMGDTDKPSLPSLPSLRFVQLSHCFREEPSQQLSLTSPLELPLWLWSLAPCSLGRSASASASWSWEAEKNTNV
jgi:hypothetical protein